ncbi:MAG: metallophosphoesterase [Candidatus Thorarchaeota archaeon]
MSDRLARYLRDYLYSIAFLADLHLDGTPIRIRGQKVDFREFCYFLLTPLTQASLIVFLGDTIEGIGEKKDYPKARAQLFILYEVLEDLERLQRSIFVLGNHDHDDRYFTWRHPIRIHSELILPLLPYQNLIIIHGHNTGLEKFEEKAQLTKEDMTSWRGKLRYNALEDNTTRKKVGIKDIVVAGHTHRLAGWCDRTRDNSLGVPPVRKFWETTPQSKQGWVGFFGFGTYDEPSESLIAIENPTSPEAFQALLD